MSDEELADMTDYFQSLSTSELETLRDDYAEAYTNGDPIVSDAIYDVLILELRNRGSQAVNKVGATPRDSQVKKKLPVYMGSLDKLTPGDVSALQRWKESYPDEEYVIMDKLDGMSCLLTRTGGEVQMYSRGDGVMGTDISHNAKYLRLPLLPATSPFLYRGELIMKKKIFEDLFAKEYRNARNMVTGMATALTDRPFLSHVSFVVYEIYEKAMKGNPLPLKRASVPPIPSLLALNGAEIAWFALVKKKDLTMETLQRLFLERKRDSEYSIDGLVVRPARLPVTWDDQSQDNPKYAFAFKMLIAEDVYETTVTHVEWNLSKRGVYKPIVHFQPVQTEDVTMSKATGHNASYILDNKIGEGARIMVTRSKGVIPYIVRVLQPGKETELPKGGMWDATHTNWGASSDDRADCDMCIKQLTAFFAGLKAKHMAEQTIRKIYEAGFDTLLKILAMQKEDFETVPGIQAKGAERLYISIHESLQNKTDAEILGASGILGFGMGVKRCEALLKGCPDLFTIAFSEPKNKVLERINSIPGFSDKLSSMIYDTLAPAKATLEALAVYRIVPVAVSQVPALAPPSFERFRGKKVVISGTRDPTLIKSLEAVGAVVTGSVSGKTDFVISYGDETTSKVQKARELGIPVVTKGELTRD